MAIATSQHAFHWELGFTKGGNSNCNKNAGTNSAKQTAGAATILVPSSGFPRATRFLCSVAPPREEARTKPRRRTRYRRGVGGVTSRHHGTPDRTRRVRGRNRVCRTPPTSDTDPRRA